MTRDLGVVVAAHRRLPRRIRVLLAVLVMLSVTPPAAGADTVDCAAVPCVALTFDDGPGPDTDRLLDILRANDARATFFLIGDRVAADPAAARRIADAGMEIGNHTWQHPDMTTLAPPEIADQFRLAGDAILAATGRRPTLTRTGFGAIDDAVLAEAGRQGLAAINWDVNPRDWMTPPTPETLTAQIRPGSVVLLHDTLPATVDAMADVVAALRADGYRLVTVSDLLGPRAPGSLYGSRERA